MANPISGSLGRNFAYTNDATGLTAFKTEWLTAAQNQGIDIFSNDFNGTKTNYLSPISLSNLTLDNNSWQTYGSINGMGVAASYAGWYDLATKARAEINYDPNTNTSQALSYKWAANKSVTSAFIDLSLFAPKSAEKGGDEVGYLRAFKNGQEVDIFGLRMNNEFTSSTNQSSINNSGLGVKFTADDGVNGDFKFKVFGNFDELRFEARPYDNPSTTQATNQFGISDSSDYLVQQIKYEGTEEPIGTLQFSSPTFSVNENGTPVVAVQVTRTGSSFGAVSATINLSNGTATAPSDYNNTPIVVNFANGSTAPQTVNIPIVNDLLVEGNEFLNLTLSNPTGGATIGTQKTASLTILDDDTLPVTAPTVAQGSPSNDPLIDALWNSDFSYWNTNLNGGKITYSFLSSAAASSYYGTETVSPVSSDVQNNVRSILNSLESLINVDFVEVQDTATNYGVLRYMFSNGPDYAYAYYPSSNTDQTSGDVHLNAGFESDPVNRFSGSPGSYGYEALIHETLHALGLKHPGNYGGGGESPPFLSPGLDNNTNTVMTYNSADTNNQVIPSAITPMAYDLRALQYIYGAKSNNAANTTYSFSEVDAYTVGGNLQGSNSTSIKQSIWDSGGIDTLDFSGLSPANSYRLDMNQGGILTTQAAYNGTSYKDVVTGDIYSTSSFGTTLANNTVIENLINSQGDDDIIANSAANRFKGYNSGTFSGKDVLESTNASDVLELSGYNLLNLTPTVSGNDLNIGLGSNGLVNIKNYFGLGGSMTIAVGSSYYTYNASLGWQVAATPASSYPVFDHATDGLTSTPASAYNSPLPLTPVDSI